MIKTISGIDTVKTGDLVVLTHELLNHMAWFNDKLAVVLNTDEDGCKVWLAERALWVRWMCIKKI